MKIENILEVIVGTLMVIIVTVLLMPKEKVSNEPIIIEDTFNEYPLTVWHDTDKKGDVVKIKYRVYHSDTFIEVVNDEGKVVHKQPFQRSPWDDGRARDFTYNWMLYYTQDYGDEIPPGEYEIRVCHKYSRNVDLSTRITI
jgi:hypothetical protein|tara:strand:- start:182 stop:604 length:423 start_codon:yes stop_codon:yes gene_type:complete